VQPNTIIVTGSAKDEYTARIGFTTGTFMKRFFTILWGVFALAAIVLYHDSITDPDMLRFHDLKLLQALLFLERECSIISNLQCVQFLSELSFTVFGYSQFMPGFRCNRHYGLAHGAESD
ncbi:unnamed protein product, partial [marine sediment metagenome]